MDASAAHKFDGSQVSSHWTKHIHQLVEVRLLVTEVFCYYVWWDYTQGLKRWWEREWQQQSQQTWNHMDAPNRDSQGFDLWTKQHVLRLHLGTEFRIVLGERPEFVVIVSLVYKISRETGLERCEEDALLFRDGSCFSRKEVQPQIIESRYPVSFRRTSIEPEQLIFRPPHTVLLCFPFDEFPNAE